MSKDLAWRLAIAVCVAVFTAVSKESMAGQLLAFGARRFVCGLRLTGEALSIVARSIGSMYSGSLSLRHCSDMYDPPTMPNVRNQCLRQFPDRGLEGSISK
jgi:hypothetical protein